MAVTGGIKFFDQSFADSKTGTVVGSVTSGAASAPFILDRNKYTYWRSVGAANDASIVNLRIDFPAAVTFNRIFILLHNLKSITITWSLAGSGFQTILDATTINGVEIPGIFNHINEYSSTYYEFPDLTADRIQITMKSTLIADQEKFINSVVVGNELGTLQGFPVVKDVTSDKKLRKSIVLNGRSFVDKSLEVFRTQLDFKNYPPAYAGDIDLLYSLFDRDDPFYIWLCGGRTGDPYFKYQLRGFRLEDLILSQTVNIFKDRYYKNLYNGPVNLRVQLEESA